jgi:ABC-2 type transport system ATP-binding protein
MDDIAIKVEGVSKTFKLPHEKQSSLKGAVINIFKGGKRSFERQRALKDISFEVKKGEFFGIVGRNGSGKSTMLKILAGIYQPTKGAVQTKGTLVPFIELGVGFNSELTGRENVYLNGSLLGFSRKEMTAMYDDIVEFAELGRFMDQKLKNYSSGMQVRLAFSIAIRAKSDIMLIDEVLAVGDAAFQRKCLSYFSDLRRKHQTVVFVSHDMESVRKYCDQAIMIENGVITKAGDTNKVTKAYTSLFLEEAVAGGDNIQNDTPIGMPASCKIDRNVMTINKLWLEDDRGNPIKTLNEGQKYLFVKFSVTAKRDTVTFVPGVSVSDPMGEFITASSAYWADIKPKLELKAGKTATVVFKLHNIYEKGDYKVSVNVVSSDLETFYAWKNEALDLYVDKKYITGGKVNPSYEVTLKS